MGSSFIEFRGKGFWSGDAFIEELLAKLAEDALLSSPADWLRRAADHWRLQSTGVFSGWIHPNFDEYLVDDDRRDTVLCLVEAIRSRESTSRYLRETSELVARLLLGQLETDASSPLDYMVGRNPPADRDGS